MATYYHGNTELQSGGDGLQTLILMNPSYLGFADNAHQQPSHHQQHQSPNTNNVGNNLVYLPHAPPQHYVGIPLSTTSTSQDQAADGGFVPSRIHYNLYNLPMDTGPMRDQLNPRPPQGLSLSLSSHQQAGFSIPGLVTGASTPHAEDVRGGGSSSISPSSGSGVTNNGGVVQNQVLLGSKYLKAAQELLDEVVNVGKGHAEGLDSGNSKGKSSGVGEGTSFAATAPVSGGGDVDGGVKRSAAELSTAERQEIQMKKAKLVNMLDEVEQRYRQYHHQMHIVITWFEQAAGLGSAKTYTALALQTISKQFRCLKDAILNQIKAASKSLGEEDGNDGKIEGSRLKYVDNQIRQQRALQQLGMIQHNAWRPQRGLPERAVSVLRAWLFEHFLHPYPKDSDKITLAKQTGLTRSQVSNWFINARVRLWKPMVEEMYMEEMKEQEKNASSEDRKTSKSEHHGEDSTSKSTSHPIAESQNISFTATQENPINQQNTNINPSFNLIASSEMDSIAQNGNNSSPKKLRISHTTDHQLLHSSSNTLITSMNIDSKPIERDTFTLMGAPTNFIGGFGSYPIAELGRFGAETAFQTPNYNSGNSVSLTLGLPHCDNNISITAAHHHSFMPSNQGVDIGESNDHYSRMNGALNNAHNPPNVYESINIQDRKRFVAQLLPDFVA